MLITPTPVTLPPTDHVLSLRPWLQGAIFLQVLVGIGRLTYHNQWGALQFFILALFGAVVIKRRYDLNWVIPYLVLSMMTFMLDLLLLMSAVASHQKIDEQMLAKHFDVQLQSNKVPEGLPSIWHFVYQPFPLFLVPILIVVAPMASGLSTYVAYAVYAEMQQQLDIVLPNSLGYDDNAAFLNQPLAGPGAPPGAYDTDGNRVNARFSAFTGTAHQL
jgi:hypothetical protein